MAKTLGLNFGSNSVGWAVVENDHNKFQFIENIYRKLNSKKIMHLLKVIDFNITISRKSVPIKSEVFKSITF